MTDPAAKVSLLCLDVDGVLTDGSILIDDHGIETKRFHVRDGTAIRLWMELGHEVAFITGRRGMVVRHRAAELGVRHVIQGVERKVEAFGELLNGIGLAASAAAMLGDDLPDLGVMALAGYPMAVADAVMEVRQAAQFITTRPGGHGAVREAIEHLLKARGRWDEVIRRME
jgi:3-deoxy-D-manno-octulosonate 8-phosphate phosphatase (KDO 8-P phosphatase)